MNSKVQCIRDLLGSTCQHRSLSPIRNLHKHAVPSTNAPLQQHTMHLQKRLKTINERQKEGGHGVQPEASAMSRFFHLGVGLPAASASDGRKVNVEIPVEQPDRPTVGDQQHNRIQMTKKLQEVRRAFGQKAPSCPKNDKYQVRHESEHYNFSARLQHLQPCRMNGFTKTNSLKTFEFPINFYS